MALVVSMRDVARAHLLRAAAHQFEEGMSSTGGTRRQGKGVRTRISDDYLWLPYAVAHYLEVTGDDDVLDEPSLTFDGPELEPDQDGGLLHRKPPRSRALAFRPLSRALDRALAVRRPRSSADRIRRLERRHEPGGPRRGGRERVARMVPRCQPAAIRPSRRRGSTSSWPRTGVRPQKPTRKRSSRSLGRRLVPTGILRRRNPTRLVGQPRVPDRLDRPVVER
jgi:hypothetical protein